MSVSIDEFLRDLGAEGPPGRLHPRVLFRGTLPVEVEAESEDGSTPVVFFPDIHFLSRDRADGYGGYFNLRQESESLLKDTLNGLLKLREKEYPDLLVIQLGDFHDLWREAEHWWWHEDIAAMIQRQVDDHGETFELFGRLETRRVVGNHDNRLRVSDELQKLEGEPVSRFFPPDRIHPDFTCFRWGFGRIGVLHADRFDSVETGFFSFLNPIGARLAQHSGTFNIGEVDEWEHELGPPGTPDGPPEEELLQRTVDFSDAGTPAKRKKYFEQTRDFLDDPDNIPSSCRDYPSVAAVIGHTHAPRIVTDSQKRGFSMVDCGSWVNISTAAGHEEIRFWNSQIGVLASNEIAVLQLGPE